MADAPVEDLLAVDREVARGAERLAKWREALRREPEAHAGEEPLEVVRRVSGKTTWEALGALSPVLLDVPLRDRLQAWVAALIAARVGRRRGDRVGARGERGAGAVRRGAAAHGELA